jgi:hypothetical protein
MMSGAPNAHPGEVSATLKNTRRVAFAIWWKLCAISGVCIFVAGFLSGFAGYVVPLGQLEFWLAVQIANIIPAAAPHLFASPQAAQATMHVVLIVATNGFAAVMLFFLINWLLARHVGRTIGGYRLVLQRAT